MKRNLTVIGAAFAAVLACGLILFAMSNSGDQGTGSSTTGVYQPNGGSDEPADTPSKVDNSALCAQIQAQKDVNQRLNSDGYAESYGAEYDKLYAAYCR